jgi:3-phenylpropionate/cinnamic acid dioxygenase small subunit
MRLRLEQRKHLDRRLRHLLVAPKQEYLATAEERIAGTRLEQLEAALGEASDPGAAALRRRIHRLRGFLAWNLETQYHERLTEAHVHLNELNADVEALSARYDSFVRARQAATHSYVGYESSIDGLRVRVAGALERLQRVMTLQGEMLESVALRELTARRERLEAYQNQARFAFADSYDRAAKTQAR